MLSSLSPQVLAAQGLSDFAFADGRELSTQEGMAENERKSLSANDL